MGARGQTHVRGDREDPRDRKDHLDEDVLRDPDQSYVLLSIVSPVSNQKSERTAVMVRGAFPDYGSAQRHAIAINRACPSFDVYSVEMYKWLGVPPDPGCTAEEAEAALDATLAEYIRSPVYPWRSVGVAATPVAAI